MAVNRKKKVEEVKEKSLIHKEIQMFKKHIDEIMKVLENNSLEGLDHRAQIAVALQKITLLEKVPKLLEAYNILLTNAPKEFDKGNIMGKKELSPLETGELNEDDD